MSAGPEPTPSARGVVTHLMDSTRSAVLAFDGGRVVYANASVVSMLGWSADELMGLEATALVPARLHGSLDEFLRSFRTAPSELRQGYNSAEHGGPDQLRVLRRDGTELDVDVRLTPLPVDDRTWVLAGLDDATIRVAAERRLRQLNRDYLTLAELNQAIVRAPDEATLYVETCRVGVEQGGHLGAWVGVPEDGRVRVVATAGTLDTYVQQLDIVSDPGDPRGQGPTARALRTGEPYYTAQFLDDVATTPWHETASAHGIASSASLPLVRDGSPVAVLCLYSDRPDVFDEQMRRLLEQVADNVAYALSSFAAHDRLRELIVQRTDLLRRLIDAEETERGRIAADLHDEPVQALAAVDLRLGLLGRRIDEDAPQLRASLEPIQDTVARTVSSLRELLFALEPPAAGTTCADAVREAAAHIFEYSETGFELDCDDVHLPPVEQMQALRIVREALINVRKHARAMTVRVVVRSTSTGVHVRVEDDGVGLGTADLPRRPGHRGLATMRDRAAATGGWCQIGDRRGGGTLVEFWIPAGDD